MPVKENTSVSVVVDVEKGLECQPPPAHPPHLHLFKMQQEVQQRFLCPEDVAYVKILCKKWFPIE